MPLLSVIVPAYNEAGTIKQILDKINSIDIDKEIIVVDDGSMDGTDKILRGIKWSNLKVIHHTTNRGKGAAVITGLSHAVGDFVIIQDADLEYDPADYHKLMNAMKEGNAELVLGARFTEHYSGLLIPKLGNRFLTGLLNFLFNLKLNDCFTCYKLARLETIRGMDLKARNFTIEIEIVAKAAKKKLRTIEVPISYRPRTYAEGKKIRWGDGIQAMLDIIRYRFT